MRPFAQWLELPRRQFDRLDYPAHERPPVTKFLADLDELAGADLMCFCPEERPCHADLLLELANDLPNRLWLVPFGTGIAKVEAPTLTRAALVVVEHLERLGKHTTAGRVIPDELRPRTPTEKELQNLNWSLLLSSKPAADRKLYLVRERNA